MQGLTLWFTGLSGSGKSTIANLLRKKLTEEEIPCVVLDGDEVRKTLSRGLGYSKEDRDKNITRIADLCKLLSGQGILTVACVISPTEKVRAYAREQNKNFLEVYVKCSLEVCEQRDPKGHYQRVRKSQLKEDFVGLTVPYEEPKNPEIILDTSKHSAEDCAEILQASVKEHLLKIKKENEM